MLPSSAVITAELVRPGPSFLGLTGGLAVLMKPLERRLTMQLGIP